MKLSLVNLLLASLVLSSLPLHAAGNRPDPLEWLSKAFKDKKRPEEVWAYYLEHRAAIDNLPAAKTEEGAMNVALGLRYLCEISVFLGKAETPKILDAYLDAIDVQFRYFVDADVSPDILNRLWESGDYDLAARALARSRVRQEEKRKRILEEAERTVALTKDPRFRDMAKERAELPSMMEIQFQKLIGDWVAVDRANDVLAVMLETIRRNFMGGRGSGFLRPEMMLPIKAESSYRAGKIDIAEHKLSEFFKIEKAFIDSFNKDEIFGPGKRPEADFRVFIVNGAGVRARMIACSIALDKREIAKARTLVEEMEPMIEAISRAAAPLSKYTNPAMETSAGARMIPRLQFSDLKERVAMAEGRFDECLATARTMVEETNELAPLSPSRLLARQRLAWALLSAKMTEEAVKEISLANEAQLKLLSSLFAAGSERQKLIYLQQADPFSLAAAAGDGVMLADLMVKVKGSVLDSLIMGRQAIAKASTEEERELFRQINEAGRALTEANLGGSGDVEKRQRDLEILQSKISQQLTGKGMNPLATTVDAITACLNPGEALCDFIRYRIPDGKGSWAWHYGAVVLRVGETPTWTPLGKAKEIDQQIAAFLEAQARKDYPAEAELRPKLRSLYDLLVAPLEKVLGDSRRLIIAPDSALTQLSFAVLLDEKQRFLSETRQIVYVTNARDLLGGDTAGWEGGNALIIADPEYDAVNGAEVRKVDAVVAELSLPFNITKLPSADRLEGTAKEMGKISKTLIFLGCEIDTLHGKEATEEKVMARLVDAPELLHFATHGFVLDASRATMSGLSATGKLTDLVPKPISFEATTEKRGGLPIPPPFELPPPLSVDQPLDRAMLALVGAQTTLTGWKNGELRNAAHDGFLSAAEVASLDLRKNFLTVLSACETAVGDPVTGQGVLGLRRGFFMAGTDHLMMTFWSLDDTHAPRLLDEFYQALATEKHPAVALAKVQRSVLSSTGDKPYGGFSFVNAVYIAGPLGMSITGKLPPLPAP